MITRDQISGLILAGGQGRRLQTETGSSQEKGLLPLSGEPLVAHMQRFMAPGVSQIFISANRHLDTYAHYGKVVADDPELGVYPGPLAGIASVSPHVRTPWLYVMPVDIPFPPVGLLDALLEQAACDGAGIYYVMAERKHPLCMLMHVELGADLRAYLGTGQRRVQDWHRSHGAVAVSYQGHPDGFHNINTPQDLQVAQGRRSSLS